MQYLRKPEEGIRHPTPELDVVNLPEAAENRTQVPECSLLPNHLCSPKLIRLLHVLWRLQAGSLFFSHVALVKF